MNPSTTTLAKIGAAGANAPARCRKARRGAIEHTLRKLDLSARAFDRPSGAYDIRITYFDEENGQSQVTLFIAGAKKATFKLDEDTDCWRHRTFKNIQVNKGDEIKLTAQAHQTDQAKLDHIEFIPSKQSASRL